MTEERKELLLNREWAYVAAKLVAETESARRAMELSRLEAEERRLAEVAEEAAMLSAKADKAHARVLKVSETRKRLLLNQDLPVVVVNVATSPRQRKNKLDDNTECTVMEEDSKLLRNLVKNMSKPAKQVVESIKETELKKVNRQRLLAKLQADAKVKGKTETAREAKVAEKKRLAEMSAALAVETQAAREAKTKTAKEKRLSEESVMLAVDAETARLAQERGRIVTELMRLEEYRPRKHMHG